MPNSNRFGDYLMGKILDSDLSITQYARLVGVDRQSISRHISKKNMPKIRVLRKYADFHGDNVGDLIDMIRSDWGYYSG